MNKTIEDLKPVLTLALEALEELVAQNETSVFAMQVNAHSMINARGVMKVIREALAEQPAQKQDEDAQCRCESSDWIPPDDYDGDGSVSAMARRTAQKQEPRGWQWLDTGVFRKKLPKTAEPNAWHALYTSPPAAPASQEEIQRLSALVRAQQITIEKLESQRQWVGLTDEEIQKEFHPLHATGLQFARAIEAKLREKNA